MKLPESYFEFNPCDVCDSFHNLRGLADWTIENKPEEIEMTEDQFWNFTWIQPLHAGQEKYWNTFHGIAIKVPEMKEKQRIFLGL